ncbi:TPM domain-containing protein [Candidatus Woesearchaeota archaeon]|nr:TPM domain-containing protein [Candidatus Woesearchaeota archaeon]
MRKKNILILFLFLLILTPICFSLVEINGFINDYAGVLTSSEKDQIKIILQDIFDSKKAEYAVVIVDSLEGSDIESYTLKITQGNLGDSEKNNGLLLLIAIEDRKYRFETGRGLEPVLPDIILARIGRNILKPEFKQGNYAEGIIKASSEIKAILVDNKVPDIQEEENELYYILPILVFIILFVILFSVIASSVSQKDKHKKKRDDSDFFIAGYALGNILRGGKGGFSGGGGFGGFGGFGGGSFGGGGASGGW